MGANERPGPGTTRMRTPFTAEVPDEFGEAEWIADLPSLPDASNEEVLSPKRLDPLGLIPWNARK